MLVRRLVLLSMSSVQDLITSFKSIDSDRNCPDPEHTTKRFVRAGRFFEPYAAFATGRMPTVVENGGKDRTFVNSNADLPDSWRS